MKKYKINNNIGSLYIDYYNVSRFLKGRRSIEAVFIWFPLDIKFMFYKEDNPEIDKTIIYILKYNMMRELEDNKDNEKI